MNVTLKSSQIDKTTGVGTGIETQNPASSTTSVIIVTSLSGLESLFLIRISVASGVSIVL
jgi:hypothetical protein